MERLGSWNALYELLPKDAAKPIDHNLVIAIHRALRLLGGKDGALVGVQVLVVGTPPTPPGGGRSPQDVGKIVVMLEKQKERASSSSGLKPGSRSGGREPASRRPLDSSLLGQHLLQDLYGRVPSRSLMSRAAGSKDHVVRAVLFSNPASWRDDDLLAGIDSSTPISGEGAHFLDEGELLGQLGVFGLDILAHSLNGRQEFLVYVEEFQRARQASGPPP